MSPFQFWCLSCCSSINIRYHCIVGCNLALFQITTNQYLPVIFAIIFWELFASFSNTSGKYVLSHVGILNSLCSWQMGTFYCTFAELRCCLITPNAVDEI